jgi:dimethylglycine dehydrogenase
LGDFTVSCLADDRFHLTASYGAQAQHLRWFLQHQEDGVTIENISDRLNGFQIAGPKSRDLLAACTRDLVDMKFLDVRQMTVGQAKCTVQRVSYTGDLGYEIFCDPMDQRALWNVLWDNGASMGITPFGMRAMMSLRLDRFFGSWMNEFSPDYTAAETGMDRFIKWDKDFIGKAAAHNETPARQLVTFDVDAADADVTAYEPIFINGEVLGFCTSGGYSHHTGKSIAFGLIPKKHANAGLNVEIEILGDRRAATLITDPIFDADGTRLRS